MDTDRWETDRALTIDTVRLAVAEQFPDVDTSDLHFLGSGWDFDVYVTRDGWAIRFPRRSGVSDIFDFEQKVLPFVRTVVPDWVAIPRVERFAQGSSEFPYEFAAHRYIPGVAADHLDVPPSDALAEQLGAVLGALHGADPQVARACDISEETEDCTDWYEETASEVAELHDLSPTIDEAVGWVLDSPKVPPAYSGPLRVVHNDLCPDHVIVDPTSGDLRGIIDWTDIALADPMLDFVVLFAWRGFDFVERALQVYPAPVDAMFRERLQFAARVRSLHWLHDAAHMGQHVAKHITWVANAFAPS